MASTEGQDFVEIDPTQLGKAATTNTALVAIDEATGATLTVDAATNATPYTIPYTTSDEPTGTKTALRFFLLNVTGALSAPWTAYFPPARRSPSSSPISPPAARP